jgi:hypothetical protein
MPAQHGFRRDDHRRPRPAGSRNLPQQRRQQLTISPSHPRPAGSVGT